MKMINRKKDTEPVKREKKKKGRVDNEKKWNRKRKKIQRTGKKERDPP